ncbi:hypothetical protein [Moorena sp. SIO3I6]|uniref:hypothetical protein n=1 Tax=Moorena sp. SIO3I6 TaxID=2607831 RepID=UPI0013B7A565|nr:hypothetical protein [Moorena sp. SIO3I6]NEP22324.1 hypothetical protein [Moorena sp. SIO3I6]NEQ79832.1 hypothetical protein [Moorena sp. SIO2I5]
MADSFGYTDSLCLIRLNYFLSICATRTLREQRSGVSGQGSAVSRWPLADSTSSSVAIGVAWPFA